MMGEMRWRGAREEDKLSEDGDSLQTHESSSLLLAQR
jgi:hypothetical protein